MPNPYDRTTHDGKPVDWLTHAALLDVEKRLGYELTVVQGSFNAGGVAASAGTHDGGGAVDLSAWDHVNKVREMRRAGFAAWYRPTIPGLWNEHIHAVLIGDRLLSAGAKAQVADYLAGRNGLANHGADDGPRDFVSHRYQWRRGTKRISRASALLERARLLLSTGIRGYAVAKSRQALRDAARQLPKP
jgi:hypothetical protein